MSEIATREPTMGMMLATFAAIFDDLPPRPATILHYAVEHPQTQRWERGDGPPICHADAEHGEMRVKRSGGRRVVEWWTCANRECGAVRSLCSIRTHGEVLALSNDAADSYCPDCHKAHYDAYTLRATPGRRLVAAEAYRRGGSCQFEMKFRTEIWRCPDRFEHGRLHWHHRDPREKVAGIAALSVGANLRVLADELAKCDLLCRCHHRIAQRETR
jgi:hypothetical protein